MKLEWMGHASFLLTAADGTRILTDPYDESVGIAMHRVQADLVTMSHEHHDHNYTDMLDGNPLIVHGLDGVELSGVKSQAVGSWHDEAHGAMRGPNAIRVFEMEGLKIFHMGDQGCMPSEAVMQAIAGADVMMIPVGGTYTVDARGAKAIIEEAKPRCVIPMHFKTAHCVYGIAGVEPFLAVMGAENVQPVQTLELAAECVPEGVVLMSCRGEKR